MTDTVTLPRAVVETCLAAARGCLNCADRLPIKDEWAAKDRAYLIGQMRELESALLDALAST